MEHSHARLGAAMIIDGREIRLLNFGKARNPVLAKLREALRDLRPLVKAEGARPNG